MSSQPPALDSRPPKRARVLDPSKAESGAQKQDLSGTKSTCLSSKLFAPYRTVGLVSPTAVPFTTVPLGKTTFQITTSVGHTLQTYDLKKGLNLQFLTRPQTPGPITATSAWRDKVLGAWYQDSTRFGIWVFKRGKKIGELQIPLGRKLLRPITNLLTFGAWIVGLTATSVEIWSSTSTELEHYSSLSSPYAIEGVSEFVGGICTMPTYLNKVFVGRMDGAIEIWNVSTGKLVYTILPPDSEWGSITALQPTPALSLLAIAYEAGPVIIQNVRTDQTHMVLNGNSRHPVSTISFRTDGLGASEDGQLPGVMATASNTHGDVTLWDLNEGGKKSGILRGAHNPSVSTDASVKGGITRIEFLPGQAILVSTGMDNCLRTWIFDDSPFSPVPRPLHIRAGHAASVSRLEFLPTDSESADFSGKWLMSASRDRGFWGWSLRRDGQSTELSQGSVSKKAKKMGLLSGANSAGSVEDLKAPPITAIACSLNRDGGIGAAPGSKQIWTNSKNSKNAVSTADTMMTGWESVVTAHENDRFARTWFWGRKRAGRWMFETLDGGIVTSVAVSPCGAFAVVGSSKGGIDTYNLQSGKHRQRFPAPITAAQSKKLQLERAAKGEQKSKFMRGEGRHLSPVTSVAVDGLNRFLISTGDDGCVKFWDFTNGQLLEELRWVKVEKISDMKFHRSIDLIAILCNDSIIRLVDVETKKVVREFVSRSKVLDYCFSNDGRWVVAACDDSVIRVWDLPTGHLVDVMKLRQKCTALAFSLTGEFLATALEGTVGIDIWTNRTLFTHVPTRSISEDQLALSLVQGPTASGEGGVGVVESIFAAPGENDGDDQDVSSMVPDKKIDQLSDGLMTLSVVPRARWQTLLHIDQIRERNRPKEAVKAPEKAPFFLPAPTSDVDGMPKAVANVDASTTHVSRLPSLAAVSGKGGIHGSADPSLIFQDLLTDIVSWSVGEEGSLSSSSSSGYAALMNHMRTMSPASTDLAIRTLSSSPPYLEFVAFVTGLTEQLRQKVDVELCFVWMRVFLRIHSDVISVVAGRVGGVDGDADGVVSAVDIAARDAGEVLRTALEQWQDVLEEETERLDKAVGFCSGVGSWVRGAI